MENNKDVFGFENTIELDHLTELQLKMVEEILLNKFNKRIK